MDRLNKAKLGASPNAGMKNLPALAKKTGKAAKFFLPQEGDSLKELREKRQDRRKYVSSSDGMAKL